ncbi:MAG: hypothetical protein LBV00_13380 [Propionibacteriaceae bacterium]|jgi:hypothetical protein|nr:hypothetical protein [Propionibacteriaceae bacterium]
MSLSLTAPAMAENVVDGNNVVTGGTATNPVKAVATKNLVMPVNTPTPDATFTFELTKVSLNGSTAAGDLTTMPTIDAKTVTLSSSDNGSTGDGAKTVSKETTDILAGITWPHEGVYTYRVTEKQDTYTEKTGSPFSDDMAYSTAAYELTVYVYKDANGTFYAGALTTTLKAKDVASDVVDTKVDPTLGGKPSVAGDYSQMDWTNTYTRTDAGNATNPNLKVSKTVAGALGDTTRYFDFSVKVTNPVTVTATDTVYKAYVVDSTGAKVTTAANCGTGCEVDGNYEISFTTATAENIKLKHGQSLVFVDTPVGTKVEVEEAATADYTPSYVPTNLTSVKGGVIGANNTATVGQLLGLGTASAVYTASGSNVAAFTNTYKTVTITGISANNLPYIVMIGLAVIGFAGYVVVRSRRRAKAEA